VELPKEGCLLRIYIGESDRHGSQELYEWLVMQARAQGLAGATVLRGIMGYGAHSRIHTFKIERLSTDLPIIVEIIDTRDAIERYLDSVEDSIHEGLVTLENVQVHAYRWRTPPSTGQKPS